MHKLGQVPLIEEAVVLREPDETLEDMVALVKLLEPLVEEVVADSVVSLLLERLF